MAGKQTSADIRLTSYGASSVSAGRTLHAFCLHAGLEKGFELRPIFKLLCSIHISSEGYLQLK